MAEWDWLDAVNPLAVKEAQAGMTYPAEGSDALKDRVALANAARTAGMPVREILHKYSLYPGYDNKWEYVSDINLGKYDYTLDPKYALQIKQDTYNKILKDSGLDKNVPSAKAYKFAVADPAIFTRGEGQLGYADHGTHEVVVKRGKDAAGIVGHEVGGHISRWPTYEQSYPSNTPAIMSRDRGLVYRQSLSEINAEIQRAIAEETNKDKIADVLDANWGYGKLYAPQDMDEALERSKATLKRGNKDKHPAQDFLYKYLPILQDSSVKAAIKARK